MFEFLLKGGKTMIPLFICSLVALTIIIERFFSVRKQKVLPLNICEALSQGKSTQEIYALCVHAQSSLSTIIRGLYEHRKNTHEIRMHIFNTLFKKEIAALERGLNVLEVIASITPLLGLLGTVLGMVDVFNVVAEIGVGQASALSSGIAKALITTIAGLSIAIPTLVLHSYFAKQSENYALALEEHAQTFFQQL